jgi:hypothetical protein
MMIGSMNLHGVPPRPSTSPVPNFFNGHNAPAGSRKVAASAAANSRSAQQHQVQQAAVRLRPLPPTTQRGGASAFGSLMMIEGRTTGEEIERSAVEKRGAAEQAAASLAAPSTPPQLGSMANGRNTPATKEAAADAAENERAKQRTRKLEADLRKALDVNKKRAAEMTDLNDAMAQLRSDLDTARTALASSTSESQAALLAKSNAMDALTRENAQLRADVDAARMELKRASEEKSSSVTAKSQSEAQYAAELSRLQASTRDAQKDADAQRRRADLLQSQLDSTRQELATALQRAEDEKLARQRSDATNIARVAQLEREAQEAREELASWRERISMVNGFVLEICQPQFAVVKDESLAPMDSGARKGAGAEGYVLVPLHLLLQGYALLPTDKKKAIADKYETTKPAGR